MIFKRAVARLRAQDWMAITIELVIVTLGVLIALAAQQWAEDRARQSKMDVSMKALRGELAEHFNYAVEYRVVYPCLKTQVDRLRERVLASGSTIDPAPLYEEDHFSYVFREPTKTYPTDAWQAAINDGTIQRLEPQVQSILSAHYGQLPEIFDINTANNAAEQGFVALTHPLPLDPSVRYSIIQNIEQVRGRIEYMDYMNGQIMFYLQKIAMLPSPEAARETTKQFGTYQFCKSHGLPMRSFEEAMKGFRS